MNDSPAAHATEKNKLRQSDSITHQPNEPGPNLFVQNTFSTLGSNVESLLPTFSSKFVETTPTAHSKPVNRPAAVNASYETDLLRHFRYHVGPWIDLGDSSCAFGGQVLLQSRSNRALQAAILALSAGQRSLLTLNHSQDIDGLLRFRKEAEEGLSSRADIMRHAGETLLLLQELLPSGFQRWRSIVVPWFDQIEGLIAPADLAFELGNSLFWLSLRIGELRLLEYNRLEDQMLNV